MVAAPLSLTGVPVDTPKTKATSSLENEKDPLTVTVDKDGKYYLVAPTDWANAELVYPRPMWADR